MGHLKIIWNDNLNKHLSFEEEIVILAKNQPIVDQVPYTVHVFNTVHVLTHLFLTHLMLWEKY